MVISETTAVNIVLQLHRRKANWFGHMLLSNCLQEYATEGQVQGRADEEECVNSYWNVNVLECERGSTGSQCLEN